ncbi:GntR family transcriptional regulator [Prauserella alba]|uniref:GntR family transcriptional regulator n=1 Tax=Prauserella alba TaxID=176898 RepID=A0ABP4G275_9PSEU|nr:GntR family transcriptional regulator [Prauserella alba]MCP2182974.1 DNA-binding transcriptional regulator, GntR family [Prauserella alba]
MNRISSLNSLEMKSVPERIADDLRQLIVDGALEPGQQLSEVALANQLGVSRSPVREALQRLVRERLLVASRNRGVWVARFTDADITEIYDARCAIETFAAQSIIDSGADRIAEVLTELRGCLDELERALQSGDFQKVSSADLTFHRALVDGARNSRLSDAYAILFSEALTCIHWLEIARPSGEELMHDHMEFTAALEAGDSARMREVIRSHLSSAARNLTESKHGEGPADAPSPSAWTNGQQENQ